MQIVIDIPEDVYTRLFDNGIQDNEIAVDDVCEMARALRLGTPLPKGHGRLIDIDTLEFRNVTVSYGYDWECGESTYAEEEVVRADDIWNAPTIIEADKESGDKE